MSILKPYKIEVIYKGIALSWGDEWMLYKRYLIQGHRDQALKGLRQSHRGTGIEFRKG